MWLASLQARKCADNFLKLAYGAWPPVLHLEDWQAISCTVQSWSEGSPETPCKAHNRSDAFRFPRRENHPVAHQDSSRAPQTSPCNGQGWELSGLALQALVPGV